MDTHGVIFVAGGNGLVGSALRRELKAQGFYNVIAPSRQELDLTDSRVTMSWFARNRPHYVFLAAAKVGGIAANNAAPVDFLQENLLIATNTIRAAAEFGVEKLLFTGSSCIYPKMCPQPIKEEYLLTGPLEPTNEWYALAKISALKLCQAYRKQHHKNFISVMPTNLYGPGDRYFEGCHVIPALIDRFHKAKSTTEPVKVWGSGDILREFLYIDDLARACVLCMQEYDEYEPINIGYGSDVTIRELALKVAETVGLAQDRLVWDTAALTGTPKKLLDSSRIEKLGWSPHVPLKRGLKVAYEDYVKRYAQANPG